MIEPKILALGYFSPDDLRVTLAVSNRKVKPEVEAQLETAWQSMLRQAKTESRQIYNGISYRLNSFQHSKDTLTLELAPFEYKVRDGLLRVPGYFNLPESYYRKGCYTAASVKTADEKYLMVELSGKSMNMNTIETLGGIVDAEPVIENGDDVFRSLFKELDEEALITEEDISSCYLRALLLEEQTNVGLYFEVRLKITAEQLISRQTLATLDQEIAAVKILTKEKYISILQSSSPSKQLIASIISL